MTWHAARAASKRSLPRPRKDHGLVTALSLPPWTARTVAESCSDQACSACGYIRCDPVFHNLPPEGWAVSGATRCTHLETGAAVWCCGRRKWAYVHRMDLSGRMDGMCSTRDAAMAQALMPYELGAWARTPPLYAAWLRGELINIRHEHRFRALLIEHWGVQALVGGNLAMRGAAPVSVLRSTFDWAGAHSCCLACGRLRTECKC